MYKYDVAYFKLAQSKPQKQFTKADLKCGMKVVYNDGESRSVFGDSLYRETSETLVRSQTLSSCKDDLTFSTSSLRIDKVYERDGTLLWQREEAPAKSEAQIELERLQEHLKQLTAQADVLQEKIK